MGYEISGTTAQRSDRLHVQIAAIRELSPNVKEFTLVPRKGNRLPTFTAGSHVLVDVPTTEQTLSKPYSLTSCPRELGHYQIVVSKAKSSQGLSHFMHECARVGSSLAISLPVRGIELVAAAKRHVLIAGGMGITPFLSQLSILLATGAAFELHYTYRAIDEDVFLHRLTGFPAGSLFTYVSGTGQRLDANRVMAGQPSGTHFYISGPSSLVESVIVSAWRLGLTADHIHFERGIELDAALSRYRIADRPVAEAVGRE